jgi:carbamoyl-phosphate synthase large subunit
MVSALLAGGLTMDEIPYWRDGTLEKYTPSGDYVVVKFARWAFEKFKGAEDKLGTQMRAVGEVMSIGKTYKEALQKAIRSLENGRHGLGFAKDFHEKSLDELMSLLREPSSERQFIMYEALRKGADVETLHQRTHIKQWFIEQMKELVDLEERLLGHKGQLPPDELLIAAKKDGFADRYLAQILGVSESRVRERRTALGVVEGWHAVPVSGVENAAYYYSTYNAPEAIGTSRGRKIMVLGGGPNRIGQGIEFDYCCVHAAFALREAGFETIMVNCNPETVSTDYDTSDRLYFLYFEPLTLEDVLAIVDKEQPEGLIVQFGGQTPLRLALELERAGAPILGTSPDAIDRAEDRERFDAMLETLGLKRPPGAVARSAEEAERVAERIGYPVLVRPSYVLGGRAMEIVNDVGSLYNYMKYAVQASPEHPVLVDRFLADATEVDVDAIADGERVVIGGIMEHIEQAGVHSGDSACAIPPHSLTRPVIDEILDSTRRLAEEIGVRGLMNVQYAVKGERVFVIEVNPRASRTVPFVSKAIGRPLAKLAALVMVGKTLEELGFTEEIWPAHISVKEAVFPFVKFPGADTLLSPEMKSTGEVMGIDSDFGRAYAKSQIQAGNSLPTSGTVLVSVRREDRVRIWEGIRELAAGGFRILATRGTAEALRDLGIEAQEVPKVGRGHPDVVERIEAGEVDLVINTVRNDPIAVRDSAAIRRSALLRQVPYFTTVVAARAGVGAIRALQLESIGVRSLQEIHQL